MPSSGSDAEGPVAETSSLSGRPDFKRILVIRRDKVGDTIMASAALKLLRSLYPSAYIAAIVSPHCKVLINDPAVVDLVIEDDPPKNKFRYSLYKTVQALRLRFLRFDVCFCLGETASNAGRLKRLAGIPVRVCPSHKGGKSERLDAYCTHVVATETQLHRHVVDECLDIVRAVTGGTESAMPWIAPPPPGVALPEAARVAAAPGKKIALCMQPSAYNMHRWPREYMRDLFARLGSEGHSLFALVVPGSEGLMRDVALEAAVSMEVLPCSSLAVCMRLLLEMDLLISVDSGQVHMAAALGVPVLSLAGPTVAETYPYAAKALALATSPGCRYECPFLEHCPTNKKNGLKPEPDFCPPCMRALSPEVVHSYARRMLEQPEQPENYHLV